MNISKLKVLSCISTQNYHAYKFVLFGSLKIT